MARTDDAVATDDQLREWFPRWIRLGRLRRVGSSFQNSERTSCWSRVFIRGPQSQTKVQAQERRMARTACQSESQSRLGAEPQSESTCPLSPRCGAVFRWEPVPAMTHLFGELSSPFELSRPKGMADSACSSSDPPPLNEEQSRCERRFPRMLAKSFQVRNARNDWQAAHLQVGAAGGGLRMPKIIVLCHPDMLSGMVPSGKKVFKIVRQ